jgi:hypothetical protein
MIPDLLPIMSLLYKLYGSDQEKSNTKSKDARRTRRTQASATGGDRPAGPGGTRTVPAFYRAASNAKHACETIAEVVAGYARFVPRHQTLTPFLLWKRSRKIREIYLPKPITNIEPKKDKTTLKEKAKGFRARMAKPEWNRSGAGANVSRQGNRRDSG